MTAPADTATQSLGDFVRQHHAEILSRWVSAIRDCMPASRLAEPALVDQLPAVLEHVADTLGHVTGGAWSRVSSDAAVEHAMRRLADGFDVRDVVTEFFLLRHVLLDLVLGSRRSRDPVSDGQLVSWAIDATIRESVAAFAATKQRALEALDRVTTETLAVRTLEELFPRLLQTVLESSPELDVACLLLVEGGRLVHRAAVGIDAGLHEPIEVAVGEGRIGKVAADATTLAESVHETDLSAEGRFLRSRGIRALYTAPLIAEGVVLGVVQMGSASVDKFSETEVAVLSAVAQRVAAAVVQRRLRDDSQELANERDRLSQQRQLALDAAKLGWWHYDPVARTGTCDPRFLEIFGLEGDPAVPLDVLSTLVHPEDLPRVQATFASVLDPSSSGTYSAEYRIQRADGAARWIEAHGKASFEGDGPARRAVDVVGTVADITERKRAEESLRRANEQLREAERLRAEFLSVLSHELRNPLAPIRSALHILDRAVPGGDQARRALATVSRQVDQLARLIEDLLDVTRITRNKIQLQRQPLELNELARRTVEDYRAIFDAAGVRLQLELAAEPLRVSADPNRLAQVIGNLLQNAAKFTPRGGEVRVAVVGDAGAKRARVQVVDTGVGMSPETLERMFQPFAQADTTLERSQGGLGLGLALVKGMVELHGGEVSAHSSGLGRGSEFVITLPLEERAEVGSAPEPGAHPLRRLRVLVIEDNADAADSLREVLEFEDQVVEVAANGPEGIAKARAFRPDLTLCDIGLPGMDGYQVAQVFRADPALSGTYLVAISGYALPEDLQRAAEAGFDRHLAKPPSIEQLESVIGSARAV